MDMNKLPLINVYAAGLYETYCFIALSEYDRYVCLTTKSFEYNQVSYPFITR